MEREETPCHFISGGSPPDGVGVHVSAAAWDVVAARDPGGGALAGMVGGAVVCVLWYVLGYVEHGTFDNWIAGLWPALVGPAVSLALLVGVSLVTRPPPREVVEVFFGEGGGGATLMGGLVRG